MKNAKTIADNENPTLPWEVFPQEGESFGPYHLGPVIGKGSFGTVFKVQPDPEIQWFEAVKILHRASGIDKQRFLEEINKLKEIRLPGIARIHATGEENGFLYYSMDYIDGLSIDEWGSKKTTSENDVFRAFIELCGTVQNLHDQNFLHLDIKPQNVMVNADSQVRLLDFGISTRKGDSGERSADGLGAGTYEFACPEQIQGQSPTTSMDVYSLACLLYTLLSFAHPKIPRSHILHEFIPDPLLSRDEIVELCLQHDRQEVRQFNFEILPEISAVLQKALGSQEERYATVHDFRADLIKSGCLLPVFRIVFDGDLEQSAPFIPMLEAMRLEFVTQTQIVAYTQSQKETGDFTVKQSDDYAEVEALLRRALFEKLAEPDEDAWQESPYKSLSSYEERDGHLFFGRDKEIATLSSIVDKLPKHKGLVTVLAPSGAGKSSFLKAGVIPLFKQTTGWNCEFVIPGKGLAYGLQHLLEVYQPGGVWRLSEKNRLLIIIDQFEEALQSKKDLSEVVEILHKLITSGFVKIILSLRNDFYRECIAFLDSASLSQDLYNLPQAGENSITRMIGMPALKAHLKFEKDPQSGKSLSEILRDDAMQNPESLAALSFTLDEIFRHSPSGLMSLKVYQDLGGMHGAMARRAESVIHDLGFRFVGKVFHQVFHQLIEVDENHIPRRLYADYDDVTSNSESQKMVVAFVDAKLFTVKTDKKTSKRIVSVSHEALIQQGHGSGWPRVMKWLSQQEENLLTRKRFAVAAKDWRANNFQHKYLFSSKDQLKDIFALRQNNWAFTEQENLFLKKSFSVVARRYFLALVAGMAILVISFYLWLESNTVENLTLERKEAASELLSLKNLKNTQEEELAGVKREKAQVSRQLNAMKDYSQLSRIASLQQNNSLPTPTAIDLLSEVREESRNWMWGQLLYNALPNHLVLFGHKEEILSVEFSPDPSSKYLLTSSWDDSAILWDSYSGESLVTFNHYSSQGEPADLEDGRFSYDGFVALACNNGSIYLWNIKDSLAGQGQVQEVKMPHVKIRRMFFSKGNKYLICCGSEGRFSIWDWQNKNFSEPLAMAVHSKDRKKRVYSAQLSMDGKSIVSAGWDGKIKKWSWDGKSLGEAVVVGQHESEIWSAEFSPNGKFYVSGGRDKLIKLWDAKTFQLIKQFGDTEDEGGHKADIRSVAFSPDSKTLITASRDKFLRIWDVGKGALVTSEKTHDNIIYSAAFSQDGKRYASVSADKVLNIYDRSRAFKKKQGELHHSGSVGDFDYLEGQLVTTSSDGEIRFWDLRTQSMQFHFSHSEEGREKPQKVKFVDSETLISSGDKGGINLWHYAGHTWSLSTVLQEPGTDSINTSLLSEDKSKLIVSFKSGKIKIWDLIKNQNVVTIDLPEFFMQDPSIGISAQGFLLCGLDNGRLFELNLSEKSILALPVNHSRKVFYVGSFDVQGEKIFISCSRDGDVFVMNQEWQLKNTLSHGVRGDASYGSLSSDGQFLVSSSSRDNNVFVWDLKNNMELLPLSGHEKPINKVQIIANNLILSASKDGMVKMWNSISWEELQAFLPQEKSLLNSKQALIESIRRYQLSK